MRLITDDDILQVTTVIDPNTYLRAPHDTVICKCGVIIDFKEIKKGEVVKVVCPMCGFHMVYGGPYG